MSFKEYLNVRDLIIPQIASGFGGGIGRKGSLCGAFIGAVMALGMKMGRSDPKDKEGIAKLYGKCQEFWKKFEKEFGSCYCDDLIHCHLDDEEERQKWLASGGMQRCREIVEKTAGMLCEFLGEMR